MLTTDQIRTMLDAATDGPWEPTQENLTHPRDYDIKAANGLLVAYDREEYTGCVLRCNAPLIAAAPDLAAEVLRLREGIKALADKWEYGATRWADPLPVPPEVDALRALLDGGEA